MLSLKIKIFKGENPEPDVTITIPLGILNVASKLIPKRAAVKLEEEGIDINEIIKLSENTDIRGTLVEIDDHGKNEKIIISIE